MMRYVIGMHKYAKIVSRK